MNHRTRLHSLLWTGAVVLATALSLVLMLQVKAVNSEIAETEKAIVAAKQQIAGLETEFQTRARQQQLVRWNEVDFGYVAPQASQFLDGRAQLAALGKPVEIIEAEPIRMAEAAAQMPAASDTANAAAPVRTASAENARPVMKGAQKGILKGEPGMTPDRATDRAVVDEPVRLAQGPATMRQLVARGTAKPKPLSPTVATSVTPSVIKPQTSARAFADRFDLDSVIAEGQR